MIITWNNGDANGQPIETYEVLCAHIRTYHPRDVIYAREAFLGVSDANPIFKTNGAGVSVKSYEDDIHDKIYKDTSLFTAIATHNQEEQKGEGHILSQHSVEWKDITSEGEFTGPQSFLVKNLLPGHAYAFKVRQANSVGWSEYSNASPLISTYPSIPPAEPLVLMTKDTFVVLGWEEVQQTGGENTLTTLEYEIQLRTLLATTKQDTTTVNTNGIAAASDPPAVPAAEGLQYSSDWFLVTTRQLPLTELQFYLQHARIDNAKEKSNSFCGVMIQQLIEFQWYIARVRTRTVIGWSPWSTISTQFRMLK
jgi:hypothetical protein